MVKHKLQQITPLSHLVSKSYTSIAKTEAYPNQP